jgi:hypothetical protein
MTDHPDIPDLDADEELMSLRRGDLEAATQIVRAALLGLALVCLGMAWWRWL